MPADLELLTNHNLTYKMQNLEVENAMLKNELNVMNREVSDLLDRLRRTEDGNVVVNGFSKGTYLICSDFWHEISVFAWTL